MVVKSIVRTIPFLLGLALAASASGQAADPRLQWHTLKTSHFEVHFHEPLDELAHHVAGVAERAHRRLSPALRHTPRERTQIVLSDITDGANGSASVIPYNAIRLFATAPDDLSPLADHDDWMTTLITHEYAHVLHLDTTGGIPAIINTLTGKLFAPNSRWPRWFIEGIAVHEESRHTSGGRIRSSIFEMYLRMDALDGQVPRIDQISNTLDRWPHGNIWYLYGGHFVRFLAERYGDEALAKVTHDAGSQLIPYSLNRSLKRATGSDLYSLYDAFQKHTRTRFQRVAQNVRRRGLRTGTRITHHGESTRTPRFASDGSLLYWAYDGRSFGQIYRIRNWQRGAKEAERQAVVRSDGNGHIAPSPGSGPLVFATPDAFRDIYRFSDLFAWDESKQALRRLSHGLRAQEPDVSPDGHRITFTVNRSGRTSLWHAQLSDVEGTRKPAIEDAAFEQVYTPRWSPDGTKIVMSTWTKGGYRDIEVLEVATGRLRKITEDRAMDTGPTWSPDGRSIFFSSDRTGIANIYRFDLERESLHQVTEVLGGAFQPEVSVDGRFMAYVSYSSVGFDISTLFLDPSLEREAASYADLRPPPSHARPTPVSVVESYDPVPTLLPRNYVLEYTEDGFGPALVVATSGSDVVGFHGYDLRVGTGLVEGNINARLAYAYRHAMLPLSLTLSRGVAPRASLYAGGALQTWKEQSWGIEAGTSYSLPETFASQRLSASFAATHVDKAEPYGIRLDPNDPPPQLPTLGWFTRLQLGWSYSDQVRTTYDISTSWGRRIAINLNLAHPALGSDFRAIGATWSIAQFLENPWIEHHVLAVRYAGGFGGGDRGRRPLYSVGGYGDATVFDGLLNNVVLGGAALRGYRPGARRGNQFHLIQLEYRFPLFRPQFGPGTLPIFINRVWASAYADTGDAFFGDLELERWLVGAGFELYVEFTTAYTQLWRLRVGLAQGLRAEGRTHIYAHLGIPF